MTDEQIFTPFEPNPPPASGETPEPVKRRKGGRRKTAAIATPAPAVARVAPPKRRAGRPRTAAGPVANGATAKIDLATAIRVAAGLRPEDATLLTQIVNALGKTKKASRARIVQALGQVFA